MVFRVKYICLNCLGRWVRRFPLEYCTTFVSSWSVSCPVQHCSTPSVAVVSCYMQQILRIVNALRHESILRIFRLRHCFTSWMW